MQSAQPTTCFQAMVIMTTVMKIAGVRVLGLPCLSCVALDKVPNTREPRCLYL